MVNENCRKEETRTPDPHVPNVVRYQLRYFPNGLKPLQRYEEKPKVESKTQFFTLLLLFFLQMLAGFEKKPYLCTRKNEMVS